MTIGQPSARMPLKFIQRDTEVLGEEIQRLRYLVFPVARTERVQAMSALRGFAEEHGVKFPVIDITEFVDSSEKFEVTKGKIMKLMKAELRKLSNRDAATMKAVLGSAITFGEQAAPEE